jgi:hypothetical protein
VEAFLSLQAELSPVAHAGLRAISLGSLHRLCAAQLKTNSQSPLCRPRSFT